MDEIKVNTPITKEWLIKKGFEQFTNFGDGDFRLEVKLPYPGERLFLSSLMPHRWICYYQVEKIAAARTFYFQEDVEMFYFYLTGEEMKDKSPG